MLSPVTLEPLPGTMLIPVVLVRQSLKALVEAKLHELRESNNVN